MKLEKKALIKRLGKFKDSINYQQILYIKTFNKKR
jgi:hypothetical protein